MGLIFFTNHLFGSSSVISTLSVAVGNLNSKFRTWNALGTSKLKQLTKQRTFLRTRLPPGIGIFLARAKVWNTGSLWEWWVFKRNLLLSVCVYKREKKQTNRRFMLDLVSRIISLPHSRGEKKYNPENRVSWRSSTHLHEYPTSSERVNTVRWSMRWSAEIGAYIYGSLPSLPPLFPTRC